LANSSASVSALASSYKVTRNGELFFGKALLQISQTVLRS
jgi:hypothetical protein